MPDPPLLRTMRIVLLLIHFVGIVVLFLPFTLSVSPALYIFEMFGSPEEITGAFRLSPAEGFFWSTLPLPFLAAIAIWLLQVRSFFSAAVGRSVSRLARVAMWGIMSAAAILHLSFAVGIAADLLSGSRADLFAAWLILGLGFLGTAGLIALAWINRHRHLHGPVAIHAGLRYAYVFGAGMPILAFGLPDDLELGGWLSFALCGLYAIEAVIFFVYGKAHPSGGASSAVLRYWLPRGDASAHPDTPVCAACGYDLRGTIPAGGRICPECGTAIVLS